MRRVAIGSWPFAVVVAVALACTASHASAQDGDGDGGSEWARCWECRCELNLSGGCGAWACRNDLWFWDMGWDWCQGHMIATEPCEMFGDLSVCLISDEDNLAFAPSNVGLDGSVALTQDFAPALNTEVLASRLSGYLREVPFVEGHGFFASCEGIVLARKYDERTGEVMRMQTAVLNI